MNAITPTVSLEDYIVDLGKDKVKSTIYTVVLQNNTDFIVSRKTLKTERELVVLISQDLYYIKDKKSGAIDSTTIGALRSFFRDIKEDAVALEQVHWLPALDKDSAKTIDYIISNEVFVDMCKHNVLKNINDPEWYSKYWEQNKKLFIQLHTMFPNITDYNKYKSCIPLIFELEKTFGYNEAIYFASQLVKSGIREFSPVGKYYYQANGNLTHYCDGFMEIISEPSYNLQLRRFIDYLLFDLYTQGIAQIDNTVWREYKDYLNMQIQFYGRIKEKYPPNFKTAHDIMTLKINTVKEIEVCENFEAQVKKIESLAYQKGLYCIVIPTNPQELAEEGVNLGHCVKSYIGRIASGECHILFLRKVAAPMISLVTLQLCGKTICQAQGQNRRPITADERRFLTKWGNEKSIQIAVS